MKKWFPSDAVFKEQLESALTVELCSECAGEEVCVDVVTVIVELLTPRFASMEELHSEGVDWNDTEKAIQRLAQLELREGKELVKGHYIRAAIAHFGEMWWKLMASKTASGPFTHAAWFFFTEPGVSPNEVVFDLIIPPKGNPLREVMLLPTDPCIEMTILDTAILYEHNYGVGLLDSFKEYMRADDLWQKLVLWDVSGAIAAVNYCIAVPGKKICKRVFTSLLPDKSALSDVEFWQLKCREAAAALYKAWRIDAERRFRNWVSAEVWRALDSRPLARAMRLERTQKRMSAAIAHILTAARPSS